LHNNFIATDSSFQNNKSLAWIIPVHYLKLLTVILLQSHHSKKNLDQEFVDYQM